MFQKKWKYFAFSVGFAGLSGQILLIRSYESIYGISEFAVGIFFFIWLISTGSGAYLGRFFKNPKRYGWVFILQPSVLLFSIIILQAIQYQTIFTRGIIANLIEMWIGSAVLIPFSLITGVLFTYTITVSRAKGGEIYKWEAVGAAAGGLSTAVFLIFFDGIQFAIMILLVFFWSIFRNWLGRIVLSIVCWGFLIFDPSLFTLINRHSGDTADKAIRFETRYGEYIIATKNGQYSLYQNGSLNSSFPDRMSAENAVHLPMLLHRSPKSVLLLGGGLNGSITEVLKHKALERLDYIEIDKSAFLKVLGLLPDSAKKFLNDAGFSLVNEDGLIYLKRSVRTYDLIIIDLPAPVNSLINRYYTVSFFETAREKLDKNGIFVFSSESSEYYISKDIAETLKTFKNTAEKIFPCVYLLPGNRCQFICSNNPLVIEENSLIEEADKRNLDLYYINHFYLHDRFSQDRIEFLNNTVDSVTVSGINTVFHPQGMISVLSRHERQFNPEAGFYRKLTERLSFPAVIIIILTSGIAFYLFTFRDKQQKAASTAIFFGGFSQMGSQAVLILGFQSIFGNLYYQQAVIIALFMLGAAGGAHFSSLLFPANNIVRSFVRVQGLILIVPIIVLCSLIIAEMWGGVSSLMVMLAASIAGWAGGAQYKIAVETVQGTESRKGGMLYALDLAGSALGALMTGLILIISLGMIMTSIALSAAGLIPILSLFRLQSRITR